jgi:catechol 2,3-dioxygenase-like lactoylglutathione lyase family enzyme
MTFAVDGLDHVHLRVRDREEAAAWYGRVLGLVVPPGVRHWAEAPGGPLFLATPRGAHCLSLFAGEPETAGDRTVAFGTDAGGFAAFLARLDGLEIAAASGGRLTRDDVVDHGGAWSLYFRDPDGNRLELTTYEDPAGAGTR